MPRFLLLVLALMIAEDTDAFAQRKDANFDESLVGTYTLPDPLTCEDGTKVTTVEQWQKKRRPELLELFRTHVYGRAPVLSPAAKATLLASEPAALGGLAARKEISIPLTDKPDGPTLELLLYIPKSATKPVPAFLSPAFVGNQAVSTDPGVRVSTRWMREGDHRATEATRGAAASRWPLEMILERGYAIGIFYYGDVEPDHAEGWKDGLRGTTANPAEWSAIGAWSYGLSRALDYFETDSAIDAKRVAIVGHSRLGKTALWSGASDERLALVISNCSGEGGAALARRNFGETTAHLVKSFPHWFGPRYREYVGAADKLPIDAHELIALIAPRPVYVASATEDLWADPKGEFLAAQAAQPVYRLFGKGGLGVGEQPAPEQPVGDSIGYHIRTGKHDITASDWECYLDFADRLLK